MDIDNATPESLNISFMSDIYPLIVPSAFESGQTHMEWTTFSQMVGELRSVGEDIIHCRVRDVGTQTDFSDFGDEDFDEICEEVLASLDYLVL